MDFDRWFGFTLRERIGIGSLLGLIIFVYFLGEFWPYRNIPSIPDLSEFLFLSDTISDLDNSLDDNQSSQIFMLDNDNKLKKFQRFVFNPNTISFDSFQLLGFNKFAAKNLTNYVNKGGKIYDSSKFKTIFGIDTNLVNLLSPYIRYPEKPEKNTYNKNQDYRIKIEDSPIQPIEINTADSAQFYTLKMLGRYNANKIIRFRTRAGGFMNKQQLLEFELVSDSLYDLIEPYILVDPKGFKKINLNTADYKTFISHPYFDSETIQKILKYRKQHGDFKDVHHLRRIRSLKEEIGERIIPYLMVE